MKKLSLLIAAVMVAGGAMAQEEQEVIKTVPEGGQAIQYSVKEVAITLPYNDQYIQAYPTDGYCGEIVWYDDSDDVYIKNPISNYVTDSYVKGKKEGDKIIVTLPQLVAVDDFRGNIYVQKLQYRQNSDYTTEYTFVPAEQDYIELEILDDGVVQMKQETLVGSGNYYPEYAWGVTYFDSELQEMRWLNYVSGNSVFTPFTDELTGLPLGASVETWVMKYDIVDRMVKVAQVADEIYISNLYDDGLSEGWIKGKVSGLQAVFPSGQYIGKYTRAPFYAYFMAGYQEPYDWMGSTYYRLALKDALVLKFDATKRELTGEDEYIILNKGKGELISIVTIGSPNFIRQDEDTPLAAPQDPVWKQCVDFNEAFNMGTWSFELPRYDINNHLLPLADYYYNIYTDGEPFTLTAERYAGVTEPMTDIPYEFGNGNNITVIDLLHTITYYFGGFEEYSIQSYYLAPDGTKHLSNRITKKVTGAVTDLSTEEPAEVEWYDLQGRRIFSPNPGVYVKISRFADGSVRQEKVSVK